MTQVQGQVVQLSNSTRPFDFTAPGVLPSVVRRYGLLYDLVEFTQIIEELRRRGRGTEEQAMRQMVRFLGRVDEIRERHRLRFEKFLGDGAFYSARSARGIFLASAELRLLYERLRKQGFPFDRGLRLAMNVGTYHLLPMFSASGDRSHFEFFGHGLVELARLTTGKTTHEVEDITDFLISAGYDLNRVLQFLEPVRHENRFSEFIKDRPYAAFIAENGELVNLGGVATESFLRDLETDWGDVTAVQAEWYGLRWLLLATDPEGDDTPWVGLRGLGTARLKGLEPTPLAEVMVFEQPPPGAIPLEKGAPLLQTLQQLSSGALDATEPGAASVEVDAAPVRRKRSRGPGHPKLVHRKLRGRGGRPCERVPRETRPGGPQGRRAVRVVAVSTPRRPRQAVPGPASPVPGSDRAARGSATARRLLHLPARHPAPLAEVRQRSGSASGRRQEARASEDRAWNAALPTLMGTRRPRCGKLGS